MGDRKLETVAREVFLSIPPDVRTGVFIDVFTSFRAGMPGISMPGGTAPSFRSKSSFIIRA